MWYLYLQDHDRNNLVERIDENDNLSLYSLCSVLYMVSKSARMMIPIDWLTIFVFWAPEAEAIM